GRDDDHVRRDALDHVACHLDAGVDPDTHVAQGSDLVVAEAQDLALARRAGGRLELAAELRVPFPDRDLVPAQARDARGLHTRRASSDDGDPARRVGALRMRGMVAADLGVDRAADLLSPADEI